MLRFSDWTFSANHLSQHIISVCCQLLSGALSMLNCSHFYKLASDSYTTSENVSAPVYFVVIFAVCIVNATQTKMFWQLTPFLLLVS